MQNAGFSLSKLHFNQTHDVPGDVSIRTLTPVSREACLRTGVTVEQLRAHSLDYFRSLPLLRNKDEETIREAMNAFEHVRLCNIAVVQDQHDEILRAQQQAKQQQQRPKSPKQQRSSRSPNRSPPTTQPLGKAGMNDVLSRERAYVEEYELKQRRKIHEQLLKAGEHARKQDMRRSVITKLYDDEATMTQDIMVRVRSEGGPSLISAVTLRGGEQHTLPKQNVNDPRYRYSRYAQDGAYASATETSGSHPEEKERDDNTRGRSRRRPLGRDQSAASPASTGQVWARLTATQTRERDVDTELSLATFRLTMREREELERRRVRAEEYEMKIKAMKEKEAQDQRAKEEKLVEKYEKMYMRDSERKRQHADQTDMYRQTLEQRLVTASMRTQELEKQREQWRRSTVQRREEKLQAAEALRRDREFEKASKHAEGQLMHSARVDTRNLMEAVEDEDQTKKEDDLSERHARAEAALQRRQEEKERELAALRQRRMQRQQHVSQVQMEHEEARWRREEMIQAQMDAHSQRMRAVEEARQQQLTQRQLRASLAAQLRKQKEEQAERAVLYKQECVLRETETEKRNKQQAAHEQRLIERERERMWRATQRRLQDLRDAATRVMTSDHVRAINESSLGDPEDMNPEALIHAAGLPSTKTTRLRDRSPGYSSTHDGNFSETTSGKSSIPAMESRAPVSTTPTPPPLGRTAHQSNPPRVNTDRSNPETLPSPR